MVDFTEEYGGQRKKVNVENLKLHPRAAAIYGHRDIENLSRDFKNGIPMSQPPVCIGDLCIIGWRRILACRMAGIQDIYIIELDHFPEVDIDYTIASSNKLRKKTPRERRNEAKIFDAELPKRQGQKPEPGQKAYNKRIAIAQALGDNTSDAEVRDLLEFTEETEHLLDTIDNKHVYLTPLAAKMREGTKLDLSQYVPVVRIPLDLCECPFCKSPATARIDIVDDILVYRQNQAA